MNEHTDLDRILGTWFDEGPTVMPDRVVAVVADRIDRQAQRRAWRIGGKANVDAFVKLGAALAAVVVVAVAGLNLLGGQIGTGRPTPTPSPTSSPTASPSSSASVVLLSNDLRSTWVADTAPIPSLGYTDPRIHLVINATGNDVWVRPGALETPAVRSSTTEADGDELVLTIDDADSGCAAGDQGRYRWTMSPDGLLLTMTAVDDPCIARRDALEREWTRSHLGIGSGGPGVLDAFDPAFLVSLPDARWDTTTHNDAVELASSALAVFAFRDPQGFMEPCTSSGGARREVAQGLDAFEAYIRELPGFTVAATDETIGGYPARHLAITTEPTPACPAGYPIVQVQPKAETGNLHWILGAGDPDSMDVVELPDRTILLQLIHQTQSPIDDRAILDSIRFLDTIADAASP